MLQKALIPTALICLLASSCGTTNNDLHSNNTPSPRQDSLGQQAKEAAIFANVLALHIKAYDGSEDWHRAMAGYMQADHNYSKANIDSLLKPYTALRGKTITHGQFKDHNSDKHVCWIEVTSNNQPPFMIGLRVAEYHHGWKICEYYSNSC